MSMDNDIKELVQEQMKSFVFSKKWSNQARLYNKCADIIYNEWDVYNENINKTLIKEVELAIPDELD